MRWVSEKLTVFLSVIAFLGCQQPASQDQGLVPLSTKSSFSFWERGAAFIKQDYDYAPSVMLDTDGRYKMWWCAHGPPHDVIWYAESQDGQSWGTPRQVLRSAGGPYQGTHACDPSVVKADNGYYYLFFTSEASTSNLGTSNSIFLAWSPDGINFNHTNGGQAVVPLTTADGTYGIGQSSVLIVEGRFIHFYTDTTQGANNIYVAEMTNGGTVHSPLNGGRPVLSGVTAADVKYLPSRQQYLVAAEGPHAQWRLSFYLLDRQFRLVQSYVPPAALFGNPCNHNPGLLGDPQGALIDETRAHIFYGSGTTTDSPYGACWNPASWDIRWGVLEFSSWQGGLGPNDCSICLAQAGFSTTSCETACQLIGQTGGSCAFPGSSDPARCCGCF